MSRQPPEWGGRGHQAPTSRRHQGLRSHVTSARRGTGGSFNQDPGRSETPEHDPRARDSRQKTTGAVVGRPRVPSGRVLFVQVAKGDPYPHGPGPLSPIPPQPTDEGCRRLGVPARTHRQGDGSGPLVVSDPDWDRPDSRVEGLGLHTAGGPEGEHSPPTGAPGADEVTRPVPRFPNRPEETSRTSSSLPSTASVRTPTP